MSSELLTFITLRPQDLEVPSGIPISAEEFQSNRIETLCEADNWIAEAFGARKQLIDSLVEIGGINGFKQQWEALAERGGDRAAAVIARSALVTTRGIEKLDVVDLMTCSYEHGQQPERKKVKWPVLGVVLPDLGSWNLAPASETMGELYNILERECPELVDERRISDEVIDGESWKLFLEHGRLCTTDDSGRDMSLPLQVRDEDMTSNTLRNGAIRLYALATFLSSVVRYSTDFCLVCEKTGDDLKRCIKCHSAVYCGRECQIQDFNLGHKKDCKLLKVLKERYADSSPIPDHDFLGAHMALESFLYSKLKEAAIPSVQEKVNVGVKQKYPDMANVKTTKSVSEEEIVNFM